MYCYYDLLQLIESKPFERVYDDINDARYHCKLLQKSLPLAYLENAVFAICDTDSEPLGAENLFDIYRKQILNINGTPILVSDDRIPKINAALQGEMPIHIALRNLIRLNLFTQNTFLQAFKISMCNQIAEYPQFADTLFPAQDTNYKDGLWIKFLDSRTVQVLHRTHFGCYELPADGSMRKQVCCEGSIVLSCELCLTEDKIWDIGLEAQISKIESAHYQYLRLQNLACEYKVAPQYQEFLHKLGLKATTPQPNYSSFHLDLSLSGTSTPFTEFHTPNTPPNLLSPAPKLGTPQRLEAVSQILSSPELKPASALTAQQRYLILPSHLPASSLASSRASTIASQFVTPLTSAAPSTVASIKNSPVKRKPACIPLQSERK